MSNTMATRNPEQKAHDRRMHKQRLEMRNECEAYTAKPSSVITGTLPTCVTTSPALLHNLNAINSG